MTNIVLLSLLLFKTNTFNSCARDDSGCWDKSICWNAQITYSIPPSTSNTIVYFEFNNWLGKTIPLYTCYTNTTNATVTCITNGGYKMSFTPLNISPLFAQPPLTNFNGYFTNLPSTTRKTNTARFPIPPLQEMQYFRIRKL